MTPEVGRALFAAVANDDSSSVTIDLMAQTLTLPDGSKTEFPIDPFSKECLLQGVDELGYILHQEPAIAAYEAKRPLTINALA